MCMSSRYLGFKYYILQMVTTMKRTCTSLLSHFKQLALPVPQKFVTACRITFWDCACRFPKCCRNFLWAATMDLWLVKYASTIYAISFGVQDIMRVHRQQKILDTYRK